MSLPKIKLEVIGLVKQGDTGKFLNVRSYQVQAQYEDGTKGNPFIIDTVVRRRPDAAVIVPYYYGEDDKEIYVYLRSCLRPAVGLRKVVGHDPSYTDTAVIWEFAAGLIEEDETPLASAKRELREEVGFELRDDIKLIQLGLPFYSSPGLSGEQLYIFAVEVDPKKRLEPTLDGGEMEKNGVVVSVPMWRCSDGIKKYGEIADSKTEIALHRLEDMLHMKIAMINYLNDIR